MRFARGTGTPLVARCFAQRNRWQRCADHLPSHHGRGMRWDIGWDERATGAGPVPGTRLPTPQRAAGSGGDRRVAPGGRAGFALSRKHVRGAAAPSTCVATASWTTRRGPGTWWKNCGCSTCRRRSASHPRRTPASRPPGLSRPVLVTDDSLQSLSQLPVIGAKPFGAHPGRALRLGDPARGGLARVGPAARGRALWGSKAWRSGTVPPVVA